MKQAIYCPKRRQKLSVCNTWFA